MRQKAYYKPSTVSPITGGDTATVPPTPTERRLRKKRGEKAQRKLLEETRNSPIIPVSNDQENMLPPRLDEQGVLTVRTAKTHALQPNLNNNNDHSGR